MTNNGERVVDVCTDLTQTDTRSNMTQGITSLLVLTSLNQTNVIMR